MVMILPVFRSISLNLPDVVNFLLFSSVPPEGDDSSQVGTVTDVNSFM